MEVKICKEWSLFDTSRTVEMEEGKKWNKRKERGRNCKNVCVQECSNRVKDQGKDCDQRRIEQPQMDNVTFQVNRPNISKSIGVPNQISFKRRTNWINSTIFCLSFPSTVLFLLSTIVLFSTTLVRDTYAKEIDSKTDLQQEESGHNEHRSYHVYPGHMMTSSSSLSSSSSGTSSSPSTGAGTDQWPQSRGDMPQIKGLNVKCEKNYMKVNIEFDRPFYGMVFSKGHYNDPKCVHMSPGTGHLVSNFDIFMNACGMTSSEGTTNRGSSYSSAESNGLYIENTIIIQYDGQVQEIYDQARRLRCTWYDYYEKAVTFKPFNVEMQDAVTANFLGDNIQCWMQIQAGKGPWASEVAGIVKIGQTMTMVLAIKDDENKFDMLVRNCVAHDGKHAPIQLVDENGCVIRPKIMSKFHKIKNFGHSATVVSYAYFQAFKFPDSMNVHFQCVIQVCRHECPEPACEGGSSAESYNPSRGTVVAGSSERDGELTSGTRTVGVGIRSSSSSNRYPIYRQAPVSTSMATYTSSFARRSGEMLNGSVPVVDDNKGSYYHETVTIKSNPGVVGLGASPRGLPLSRTKRHVTPLESETNESDPSDLPEEDSTEIKTSEKVIQVVAPGDVAFSLATVDSGDESEGGWNRTSLEDLIRSRNAPYDDIEYLNSICISSRSFISGLVILFSLLIISCLMSAFLYVRLRSMSNLDCYKTTHSESSNTANHYFDTSLNCPASLGIITYDNPEFLSHHPSLTYHITSAH